MQILKLLDTLLLVFGVASALEDFYGDIAYLCKFCGALSVTLFKNFIV